MRIGKWSRSRGSEIYEQIKFVLAELVRSGPVIATERETDSKKKHDAEQPWRDILESLVSASDCVTQSQCCGYSVLSIQSP